jgi:hypothetical protein
VLLAVVETLTNQARKHEISLPVFGKRTTNHIGLADCVDGLSAQRILTSQQFVSLIAPIGNVW